MDKSLEWIYDDMKTLSTVWPDLSGGTQELIAKGMAGKSEYAFCGIMDNIVNTNKILDDLLNIINENAK